MTNQTTKADIGRRRLLLAGTALPVLSVASCGLQLQQAQGQPSSSQSAPAAAGNAVAVAPSDTIVAIQAKLNSVPTGGTLEFPANSVFNFNGQTVRGKSGITVLAKGPVIINGARGRGTAGAFDFGGLSSWTLRGRAPGQGFVFNNTLVNADGSKQGAVGHCVFNNVASNGFDGSAIRMTGASFLLVINNDFNDCQGGVLGHFDWDNIRIDGNHFTNCWQPVSIGQGDNASRGRNIKFINNVVDGFGRGGFETGGTLDDTNNTPGQIFTGLVIDNNHFINYGTATHWVEVGPVSIVARRQRGTKVTNNFFRRGSNNPTAWTEAIEINSELEPAETIGNLIVDVASPFPTYGRAGQNVHGNSVFNVSQPIPPGNTTLTARPADPAQPVRVAW